MGRCQAGLYQVCPSHYHKLMRRGMRLSCRAGWHVTPRPSNLMLEATPERLHDPTAHELQPVETWFLLCLVALMKIDSAVFCTGEHTPATMRPWYGSR